MADARFTIIPKPVEVKAGSGTFRMTKDTIITYQPTCENEAEYLAGYLRSTAKLDIRITPFPSKTAGKTNIISLGLEGEAKPSKPEGYALDITPQGISIVGSDVAGCFYGIQSIRQLLTPALDGAVVPDGITLEVPGVSIRDHPRFPWRGFMLDECRHFFGKVLAKRMIDIIALYKFNKLHWHLTEDEGWRIESKRFPRLHEVASKRPLSKKWKESPNLADPLWHGGYYTHQEIEEIIAHARARHVEVIPEIEMPGHATAPLVAYPEHSCARPPATVPTIGAGNRHAYCAGKETTYAFLKDVLQEVMDIFGGDKIHIGGDELPAERWKSCPDCQGFMKARGFPDIDTLQVHFAAEIAKFLASKGRTTIGWFDFPVDKLLGQGVDPAKLIFQFWVGSERKMVDFVRKGGKAIVSNHKYMYLDYPHWRIPLKKAYSFDPIPDGLEMHHHEQILGMECPIWTERVPSWQRLDFQVFPRALAYAEMGWTPKTSRFYPDFLKRLRAALPRLDAMCVYYAPLDEATNSFKARIKPPAIRQ
ncbi:MAG: beta-N-acetylhexosaminidase, partial [Candidatus Lokiarchaeota archaeon]|nr:beta-N-acetylhexosaminidase [Candidatus Lokiarchaeota archaeon]